VYSTWETREIHSEWWLGNLRWRTHRYEYNIKINVAGKHAMASRNFVRNVFPFHILESVSLV